MPRGGRHAAVHGVGGRPLRREARGLWAERGVRDRRRRDRRRGAGAVRRVRHVQRERLRHAAGRDDAYCGGDSRDTGVGFGSRFYVFL